MDMEFTKDGGILTLEMRQQGLWEIHVPWAVAIEGWMADTGAATSDKDQLKKWMDDKIVRFADMVAARLNVLQATAEPDDPRVTAVRIDRVAETDLALSTTGHWYDHDGTRCIPAVDGEGSLTVALPAARWVAILEAAGDRVEDATFAVSNLIDRGHVFVATDGRRVIRLPD